MRWRCAAAIFHRSAVLSRRTSALLHLTICFPESDGAANHTSGNKNNQQFPPLTSKIPIQSVMEVVLDRYSDCNGDFVLLDALSCGFEADGANESIKIVDDALIEAIELRSL
jgi:hypothetical protein